MELIEGAIRMKCFPGAVAAVGRCEGIYRMGCYGNRCIYPDVLPMNIETRFDMASLTKIMATDTLFMVFMEKGLISVYDRVADYLKCFNGCGKDEVTMFNLLTHTAGFIPFTDLYNKCSDYEDAIKYICSTDLQYKPGSKVVYSDFSFILLGYILEKIGGDRLGKLCKKYIFDPLGMTHTSFNPAGENIAATEIDNKTGKPLIGTVHDENARFFGGISGHAGLFSNIKDAAKFANMFINGGRVGDVSFLSPVTVDAMTRNYTRDLGESRGLGWCIKGDKISSSGDIINPSAFGHTGFTGTSMWIDRINDIYIILLTNRVHPTRENAGILRFRRLFHNAVLASIE